LGIEAKVRGRWSNIPGKWQKSGISEASFRTRDNEFGRQSEKNCSEANETQGEGGTLSAPEGCVPQAVRRLNSGGQLLPDFFTAAEGLSIRRAYGLKALVWPSVTVMQGDRSLNMLIGVIGEQLPKRIGPVDPMRIAGGFNSYCLLAETLVKAP